MRLKAFKKASRHWHFWVDCEKFSQLLINASRSSNAKHLDNRLSQGIWYLPPLLCYLSDPDFLEQRALKLDFSTHMLHTIQSISFPDVCARFCPWFISYSAQLHIIIVILPGVFLLLWDIFQNLELWKGNIRTVSFRGASIYIFDKYLPKIMSVKYHYISASLVGHNLSLDLLV